MENKFIENIKIAELDPSKIYFLQISGAHIPAKELQIIYKYLKEEFDKYNINHIMLFTPEDVECKFTEVKDGE